MLSGRRAFCLFHRPMLPRKGPYCTSDGAVCPYCGSGSLAKDDLCVRVRPGCSLLLLAQVQGRQHTGQSSGLLQCLACILASHVRRTAPKAGTASSPQPSPTCFPTSCVFSFPQQIGAHLQTLLQTSFLPQTPSPVPHRASLGAPESPPAPYSCAV